MWAACQSFPCSRIIPPGSMGPRPPGRHAHQTLHQTQGGSKVCRWAPRSMRRSVLASACGSSRATSGPTVSTAPMETLFASRQSYRRRIPARLCSLRVSWAACRREREREDWSGRRVSNPRHSAWKAATSERCSTVLRGPSVACPVIVSSIRPLGGETHPGFRRPGRCTASHPRWWERPTGRRPSEVTRRKWMSS
jgi:hypothetical protein